MKNFKRLMAGLMAISMVATVGVSTLVSAEETQKTFYTGDVNLDGKVNTLDLLTLKKMLLGLADLQEMYIDGDTLKKVETQGEEVTVIATTFDVDIENNAIHVEKQYAEVINITLKVTDNTVFKYPYESLEDLIETIPEIELPITYNSATNEIISIGNVELATIFTGDGILENYVHIYADEKRVHHEFGYALTETDLNITDDTEITRNGESITLDELSDLTNADGYYYEILIKYNPNTNDITELTLFDVVMYPTSEGYIFTLTVSNNQYEMYINSQDGFITIPELNNLRVHITDDTIFEGINSLADTDETTHLDITYNSYNQEIVKVYAWQDPVVNYETLFVMPYSNTSIVSAIDNTIVVDINGEELTLTVDDNTTYDYTSLVHSFDDIQIYMNCAFFEISYNADTNVIANINAYEISTADKPVIYLYPTEETEVNVSLDLNGELTCTYPKYENGWSVIAEPDGTLYDTNGNEYYCLYWEGIQNVEYDFSKGFVVKGEDTADFLREKLLYMGLTPKEANEFIIYWLPRMENNEYNLITFQDDIYTENAKLDITPTPDSMLRIFMAYKPLDNYIDIEEQELPTFERTGFSVVEWGGTEIK